MATTDEEKFLRTSLLLLKESSFIAKEILLREEQKQIRLTGRDLDDLLKENRNKIEHEFKNYKQMKILFPPSGKTEIEKWDISLLTGILLIVFKSSLSAEERKAVKHIKQQRNEIYAHTATACLSDDDYTDICDDLIAAFDDLASGFSSEIKSQCKNIVDTCLRGALDVKSHVEQLKRMSETDDMFRAILAKIDTAGEETTRNVKDALEQKTSVVCEAVTKSEEKVCRTISVRVEVVETQLDISGNGEDQPEIDLAENIIATVTNEAIRRANTSEENTPIRKIIQEILDEITSRSGVKPIEAEQKCVIIRFDCDTYEKLFSLITYMKSEDIKDRLNKLSVLLSRHLNTKGKLHVTLNFSLKTLQSFLDELATGVVKEYKRSVRIPIQIESVVGGKWLEELFRYDGLTKYLNKLSEALSEKVGARINVKSSINMEQLQEALEDIGNTNILYDLMTNKNKKKTMETDDKMDNDDDLKKLKYKNWVRGAKGLEYLQKGLQACVAELVLCHRDKIVQNIARSIPGKLSQCNQCSCINFLPEHAVRYDCRYTCIQRKSVNCFGSRTINRRVCPNGICSKLCDEIINSHRHKDPLWANTDPSTWCSDPAGWSFAKCFQTIPNQGISSSETDAAGLLSIILNDTFFQNEVTCNLAAPNNEFFEARVKRNIILTSPKMELEDTELQDCIDIFINVLKDLRRLRIDPTACEAIQSLVQLKNNEITISLSEEVKLVQVRKEALLALEHLQDKIQEGVSEIVTQTQQGKIDKREANTSAFEQLEEMTEEVSEIATQAQQVKTDIKEAKSAVLVQLQETGQEVRTNFDTQPQHALVKIIRKAYAALEEKGKHDIQQRLRQTEKKIQYLTNTIQKLKMTTSVRQSQDETNSRSKQISSCSVQVGERFSTDENYSQLKTGRPASA